MDYVITLIQHYGYFILFPIAAFEGPVVSLVVGFLIYLGYLQFIPSYIILLMGDLIPDVFYYYVGRYGRQKKILERYKDKLKFINDHFHTIEKLWKDHGRKTMFFSKLAYGLSTPFLISAGLVNMSLKRFVSLAFPITMFQYAVILTIGISLGQSYEYAAKYIGDAGFLVAGLVIIFIAGYIILTRFAKKEIVDMEMDEEKEELKENK